MRVTIKNDATDYLATYAGRTLTVIVPDGVWADHVACVTTDPPNNRLHVMLADVSRIEDDARPRTIRCDDCGHALLMPTEKVAMEWSGTACQACHTRGDTDHIGKMRLMVGPRKPPSKNTSKYAHRIKARENLDRVICQASMNLRLVDLLPEALRYDFCGWGLGYMCDAMVVIGIDSMADILPVMEMMPPIEAARVKEQMTAASVIPQCRVGKWAYGEKVESWSTQAIAPLYFEATPRSRGNTTRQFVYFTQVGEFVTKVEMRIDDDEGRRIFQHEITDAQYLGGELVAAVDHHDCIFRDAELERVSLGMPGHPRYLYWWKEDKSVDAIVNTPLR